jgi:hypothetical protein
MSRTRKCECGHTWNEHDALTDSHGAQIIVCMHVERPAEEGDQFVVCSCKDWNPIEATEV